MENGDITFPADSHMLGDLAYQLRYCLLVGFKDHGNLTNRQKNFNLKLSQTRAAIENAFALLKGRFRRLKFMETVRLDLICLLIVSACVLHNICILKGDNPEHLFNLEEELEEERRVNGANILELPQNNQPALEKRANIMNGLPLDVQFL
ncbi:unnamed protein product [Acanthoscelides obtectus]|uniref:DDE Tnp4 domain-containing protein n=1 Tax=Acanthoscelides obtectus TaxID=200917 RepID=A0A9P0PAZ3_ACAOB|nr:unnamed protein product [Acanthoscelides obtectus]CAK1682127.1 hypothetical protein AOBTE_LOCUS33447 [Acanthoscelides obtectus]